MEVRKMTRPSEIDIRAIPLDLIEVGSRLRSLDRDWVATLADSIRENGQQSPIEVVAVGERFRLVFGAHRIGAMRLLQADAILAVVKGTAEVARTVDERLREIAESLVRRELTVLDHAVSVATWRDIYNAINPVPKPGRPKKVSSAEAEEEISLRFATSFSEAAKRAMDVSRAAVFRALKVASIAPELREKLTAHPIADNQSELLALAAETHARQVAIVALLTADPAQAGSVADAIAIIDKLPAPAAVMPHQRLAEGFARLKPEERDRFFEMHVDDIDRWLAAKGK